MKSQVCCVLLPLGCALVVLLWSTGCRPSGRLSADPAFFVYQNPITNGIDPKGFRDCHVFRDGDRYYMTGTSWPHWSRQEVSEDIRNPGIALYSSDDLLNWEHEKVIVPRPGTNKWYLDRFWAPEVHKINGKYYATFNCRNDALGYIGQHGGFAVSNGLLGPYTVVTDDEPLMRGNDLTLYQDDDGSVWAFFNRGREFGIGGAEVDLETGKWKSEPQSFFTPGEPGKDWDSIGIEGPYVVKRDGEYYMFYSSWSRGYEIGVATAGQLAGPWTKFNGNPVYGAQSEDACKKNGLPYSGDPDCPFNQVGHNEVFTGPDGRLWLSCHGIIPGGNPMLVIDPIDFDPEGNVVISGPTYTQQRVPTFPGR